MSAQNTLSRREALSLLGVTTGSVVATTLIAQTAGARSHEVIGAATSTRPQYVFGYGSLIERQSRMATWPSAEFASPVAVKGIARGGGALIDPTLAGRRASASPSFTSGA